MKPVCSEISYWHGKRFLTELFDSADFTDLKPITQVKGVCFCKNKVVMSTKWDGDLVFPGGTVEKGEKIEETLERELKEEASLKIVNFGPSCFLKVTRLVEPEEITYNVRFWVEIELLDQKIKDPDEKSVDRKLLSIKEFPRYIHDEKRNKVLEISRRLYEKSKNRFFV